MKNRKNILDLCSDKKEVTSLEIKKVAKSTKKPTKKNKGKSVENIKSFVIANGKKFLTKYGKNKYSYRLAEALKVEPIRIAGCIAGLKRSCVIDENFNLLKEVAIVVKDETKPAFNNYDGFEKTICRITTAKHISKSDVHSGIIAGLSAAECRMELAIVKKIPLNTFIFEGYEIELDTCEKMKQSAVKNNLNLFAIPLSISVALKSAESNKYAHLLLDYCANFLSIVDDLITVFSNNIVGVNGIVAITIGTRYKKSNFVETFGDKDCVKDKNLNAFSNFMKQYPNYKIIDYKAYKEKKTNDKDVTAGMLTVFVKRIK